MQLAEENQLCIDDPVKKYLPEFPYSAQITIKQLLTHSAGIPNPIPLNWILLAEEEKTFDRNEFFAVIFRKHNSLKSKPGEKFSYSNLGYLILGNYFAHAGGGGGYYSEIRIYPELEMGSVIMFYRTGMTDERYLHKVDQYFIKRV